MTWGGREFQVIGAAQLKNRLPMSVHLKGISRSGTADDRRDWVPLQMSAQSVHALPHNYATKSPLVTVRRPKFTPEPLLPLRRLPPPSNAPIPRQTPITIPHGIQIHWAVLPQYTFWTVRQTHTHTHTHRSTDGLGKCSIPIQHTLTILKESDALICTF